MIEIIKELPDFAAGFHAEGKVTQADYEKVVAPVIHKKLDYYSHINVLYDIADPFDGFDLKAAWWNTCDGMRNFYRWHRVAVVSDHFWVQNSLKFWTLCLPRYMKVFYQEDLDYAMDWVSAG